MSVTTEILAKNSTTGVVESVKIADSTNVAPAFSISQNYVIGNVVQNLDDGYLYKFISNHSAGAWNSSHVTQIKVSELAGSLESDITDLESAVGNSLTVGTLTENRYINKNTGAISGSSSGSKATGFIPIPPGSKLILTHLRGDGSRGTCFYSSNTEDSFISAASLADSSDIASVTVTAPDNATYIRMTGHMNLPDPTITVVDIIGIVITVDNNSRDRDASLSTAIDSVQSEIDDIVIKTNPCLATIADFTEHGYLSDDGSFTATTGSNGQWSTDYIEISDIVYYKIARSKIRKVCIYNSMKTFLTTLSSSIMDLFRAASINNGVGAKYIRLNINEPASTDYVNLYAVKTGYQTVESLNSDISVPIKAKHDVPYIGIRKPLIAFILDGEYDMNDDMHDVFVTHNMFCGFAPQYSTEYTNNSLSAYLAWQAEGFEILSHGAADLSPETTLTDEQAKASIDRSYNWMVANGLNVKGYIGLSGAVQPKFIPHIAKYFDWAATTWNHAAEGATYSEPCMFYGTDRPYYAWRYSMQRSDLAAQKAAVDRALANNGLLLFYGHAKSENEDYFTAENLDALLTYIETVGGEVVLPTDAIKDYFAIRYDDIYNILHT